MHELSNRTLILSTYLSQSPADFARSVNEIYEAIVVTEVIDRQWLEEMVLRHRLTERQNMLEMWKARLRTETDSLIKLEEEEQSLLASRKKYTSEVSCQGQLMQKRKSRFEDVEYQLNTFSEGVSLVSDTDPLSNTTAVSERMRCVFNELRRVNANIEEKLVIAGVAKQRIMKDIRTIYVDLRAGCSGSHSPSLQRKLSADFDDDPNLSLHKIRDMKSVWRATLPSVPSVSGDPTHSDLVTALSISMGHFAEDIVRDLAGTLAAISVEKSENKSKQEESKLVGVISVETNRYRSISASLRCAIEDSKKFISDHHSSRLSTSGSAGSESSQFNRVLLNACEIIQQRLDCHLVVLWRKADEPMTAHGFTPSCDHMIVATRKQDQEFAFEKSHKQTYTLKRNDSSGPSLPPDVAALASLNLLPAEWELFGVSLKNFGLLVIRDIHQNTEFDPFSGIYAEQFFRRVLTAISPLQVLEVKHISNHRPLLLTECMFNLRCSGNTLTDIVKMSSQHMHDFFRAENFALFVAIDQVNPDFRLIRIGHPIEGNTRSAESVLQYIDEMPSILSENEIEARLIEVIDKPPIIVTEAFKSGQDSTLKDENTRHHIRTMTRGRTVTFVAYWMDNFTPQSRPRERELLYNTKSATHAATLDTYLEMVQAVLTPIFSKLNSNFDERDALFSYHVIDEIERNTIKQLLKLS